MSIEPLRLFAKRSGNVIVIIAEETSAVQQWFPAEDFTEEDALMEYKAKYLSEY
ncbi:hypothetical protein [Vibrio alfacsensis]|uniref:hypothetical protein n=1 Tax=Vibrio TaxID=662 RepID=UPI004067AECB